jgi:hypothetical protein
MLYFSLMFYEQNQFPFHHGHCWHSCANKADDTFSVSTALRHILQLGVPLPKMTYADFWTFLARTLSLLRTDFPV